MAGVPTAWIEGSYRGHKAVPGQYTVQLSDGESSQTQIFTIKKNPLYEISQSQYEEYHDLMSIMEASINEMHGMINDLYEKSGQLKGILKDMNGEEHGDLKKEGQRMADALKKWDEDMVQRKSKAYDDVENFENKFTANYMFLVNQTESDIPRVTQAVLDRKAELDAEWMTLKKRGEKLKNEEIPKFNKALWAAGIGAIR